jgi:hypothetical protein
MLNCQTKLAAGRNNRSKSVDSTVPVRRAGQSMGRGGHRLGRHGPRHKAAQGMTAAGLEESPPAWSSVPRSLLCCMPLDAPVCLLPRYPAVDFPLCGQLGRRRLDRPVAEAQPLGKLHVGEARAGRAALGKDPQDSLFPRLLPRDRVSRSFSFSSNAGLTADTSTWPGGRVTVYPRASSHLMAKTALGSES